MADPNETLDPEPVDAEFEPADDSRPDGGKPARSGPGWISLFTVFLLASAAGGAIGYAGQAWLSPEEAADPAVAENEANLGEAVEALQARLARLERDGAGAASQADLTALAGRVETLEEADPAANGAADLSALESRIAALENAPVGAQADTGALEARIDEMTLAVSDAQGLAQQALDTAEAGGASGIDPQILENITARLSELETASDRRAATGTAGPDPRIAELEAGIESLRAELAATRDLAESARSTASSVAQSASGQPDDAQASRRLAARALALTALREVAMSGEGFEAERAALARLWRDNADLEAMQDVARAGVPTLEQLRQDYPGGAIRDAAGPGRMFFGLIEVRQSEPGADQTGPLAITALAEDRLAENDLDGAIALTERLEGEALTAARDWLISARARQELDLQLARLRRALADDAAALGEDPS